MAYLTRRCFISQARRQHQLDQERRLSENIQVIENLLCNFPLPRFWEDALSMPDWRMLHDWLKPK
jgi:hypothetical protein